jgi:Sigma-70 region 2
MAPDLLEALRHHESAAAECLVGAYGERTYRLAARITRNEQDAEEVVQDAVYTVIRKIDTFRGDSGFGSAPAVGDVARCVGMRCSPHSMSKADTSRPSPTGRQG